MEMPLGGIETRACGDVLAAVMQKAVVEVAFGRREDQGALGHSRMSAQDVGDFFGEWDGAFFPIFWQKRILRFCPDVDTPVGEVKVRPVERLEFAAPESSREH